MKKPLLILAVLTLLAAGCSHSQQSSVQTPTPVIQNTTTTPTTTASPTNSNTQTYTSASFGYSIQYPASWTIDNQRSSANEVVFNNGSPESHISISVQPYAKTVAEWKNNLDKTVITQTKAISINGQS